MLYSLMVYNKKELFEWGVIMSSTPQCWPDFLKLPREKFEIIFLGIVAGLIQSGELENNQIVLYKGYAEVWCEFLEKMGIDNIEVEMRNGDMAVKVKDERFEKIIMEARELWRRYSNE